MNYVIIKPRPNGPYEVKGRVILKDTQGNLIPTPKDQTVFLCRCGGSTSKPFCDGTHSKIGFQTTERAGLQRISN